MAAGFCGAVTVHLDGASVLSEGVGEASIELGVPNTTSSVFRIGSVSKQFTAVCILLLQDRAVLTTSDTVGQHMPDAPDVWQPLTIHQLLTHTSGIMHSWDHPDFTKHMAVETTLEENLARFHDQPLLFQPGAEGAFQYATDLTLPHLLPRMFRFQQNKRKKQKRPIKFNIQTPPRQAPDYFASC